MIIGVGNGQFYVDVLDGDRSSPNHSGSFWTRFKSSRYVSGYDARSASSQFTSISHSDHAQSQTSRHHSVAAE